MLIEFMSNIINLIQIMMDTQAENFSRCMQVPAIDVRILNKIVIESV